MAAGNFATAGELEAEFGARLRLVVRRRLASFPPAVRRRFDEDDVLQEAWLIAITRSDEYPREGSLFLWLRRICIDQLLMQYRRHVKAGQRDVRRETGEREFSGETSQWLAEQFVSSFTTASKLAARHELKGRLIALIEGMDEKDREILTLRHFEELTNQEVAELLDLSPQAASVRYTRALTRLAKVAEELAEFLE